MRKILNVTVLLFSLFFSVQGLFRKTLNECFENSDSCELGYQNPSLIEDRQWGFESPVRIKKRNRIQIRQTAGLTKWITAHLKWVSTEAPIFGAVQRAVWTGDLSELPFWLIQKYRDRGLLPVLALSGQHVSSLSIVLMTLAVWLWQFLGKPRGFLFLGFRNGFKLAIALFLLGLAPTEMSMVRTAFFAMVFCFIKSLPVQVDRPYLFLIGFLALTSACPNLLWSKGFVLSAHGALGVLLSGKYFLERHVFRRSVWLLLWFVPLIAFLFSNFVGTWFWLQWGMGWTWDQVFLPLSFTMGLVVFVLPADLACSVAKWSQKFLEGWLDWESRDLTSPILWVYRPRAWEVLLFLAWLIALACWNRMFFPKHRK